MIIIKDHLSFQTFTNTELYKIKSSNLRYIAMEIAPYKKPRKQNIPGNLYVDESCIDCDVCRWMCPSVYKRIGIKAAIYKQPSNENEKLLAYAAMISCPVGSIRTYQPDALIKTAFDIFPAEIDSLRIPNIYHVGFHSPSSSGATSYLIKHKDGNIMIDSPRFNSK